MIDSQKLGLILVLALVGVAWGACRRQSNSNGNAPAPTTATESMTPPPFATKEPAQYQANIVIETVAVDKQNAPLAPAGSTTQFVARSGERRRLDYEPLPGVKATIINTPEGDYLLLPMQKIYSVVKPEKPSSRKPTAETPAAEESLESFSPEKLLNPQLPGARYENLGADNVNGRAATKYRNTVSVTLNQRTHTTETLLWVDNELGLPVKEETVSSADGLRRTLEYRNIKTDVATTLFEIPKDYRQVSQQELQQRARPDAAKIIGRDRDEAPHDEKHLDEAP